jgi:hypothetical protein
VNRRPAGASLSHPGHRSANDERETRVRVPDGPALAVQAQRASAGATVARHRIADVTLRAVDEGAQVLF